MPLLQDTLILEHLTVGPFQTNVYVVGCAVTKQGAIIDAGGDADGLLHLAASHDLEITKILQTHAHIDHVAALPEVKARTNAPIYLHPADTMLYDGVAMQSAMFGIKLDALPPVDHALEHGQTIRVGELEAQVLLMPGHSPGSVIFYFEAQQVMVSGDVLFMGSMGRVDLPGSDQNAMRESLRRLRSYPDAVQIFCGHGPSTSLGREKQTNPFLSQDW